jgi:hypothetical protein
LRTRIQQLNREGLLVLDEALIFLDQNVIQNVIAQFATLETALMTRKDNAPSGECAGDSALSTALTNGLEATEESLPALFKNVYSTKYHAYLFTPTVEDFKAVLEAKQVREAC